MADVAGIFGTADIAFNQAAIDQANDVYPFKISTWQEIKIRYNVMKNQNRKGVTLIEMVVAVAIMLLFLAMGGKFLRTASRVGRQIITGWRSSKMPA